jgi:hypothetical protein
MVRWLFPLVVCAGCGDNLPAAPDAPPADAIPEPDAPECAADITSDESNCGACENLCNGGEVCKDSECGCPSGVVPPLLFPTGVEQFLDVGLFTLTLAPTLTLNGVNGIVFGHDASIPLNTDIDLSDVSLGQTPFVGALAGVDLQSFALDASYIATAGTIRFTKRCDTEIEGTLTDATFNGISGGLLGGGIPMVDPDGCEIHVSAMPFHVGTEPCP